MARGDRSFNYVGDGPSADAPRVPANDNGMSQAARPVTRESRGGSVIRLRRPANDNSPAEPQAANDNIIVVDDLTRPIMVVQGEGELVRVVLGKRLLEILNGED